MHLLSLVRNEHMKIFSRFRTWSFMVLLVLLTLLPLFLQNKAPQEGNWQTQLEQENIQLQKTVGDPEMPQSEVQSLRNKIMVNEYRIAHSIKPYNSVWGTVNELSVYIAVVTFFYRYRHVGCRGRRVLRGNDQDAVNETGQPLQGAAFQIFGLLLFRPDPAMPVVCGLFHHRLGRARIRRRFGPVLVCERRRRP